MLKEKRKDIDVGLLKYVFPAAHPNISGTASATQIHLVLTATFLFLLLMVEVALSTQSCSQNL